MIRDSINFLKKHESSLYLWALVVGILDVLIGTTMIVKIYPIIGHLLHLLLLLALLYVFFKIFFVDDLKPIYLIGIFILIAFIFINGHVAREQNLLYTMVFLVGMKDVPIKKIIKTEIITTLSVLCIIILLSLFGVLPNLQFPRNGLIRNSLGFIYPLLLSSTVFFLNIALASYLVTNKISLKKKLAVTLAMAVATIATYLITDSRTDLLLNIAILIVIILSCFSLTLRNRYTKLLAELTPILIAFWTFISMIFYRNDRIWLALNSLFSNRLALVHEAYLKYIPGLLGQYIKQRGNGGKVSDVVNYFYIDSSFSRVLFMDGYIVFVAIMVLITIGLGRLVSKDSASAAYLTMIVIITLIEGIFTDHMFFANNVALFILASQCMELINKPSKNHLKKVT
ncbi:hypothetical protein [Fructilactobacillus fructivorans]|uniref:hypothetical protein n=1 Tax=Fructilactobacillus fructivorans TaxID=1614 RepID=UPI000704B8A7|nr:hypothetical protein [Fructilactobacillus fructivorans]KRN40892.1 oligosaccharide repeat unit polymerase wzy [Fructilactobacillus fructivorans]KRN42487.1 oligosaccharide repeat unit polymerase wzy [Fructilactobacillus fructivorans]